MLSWFASLWRNQPTRIQVVDLTLVRVFLFIYLTIFVPKRRRSHQLQHIYGDFVKLNVPTQYLGGARISRVCVCGSFIRMSVYMTNCDSIVFKKNMYNSFVSHKVECKIHI